MTVDLTSIAVTVVTSAVTVVIAFYVKDFLSDRAAYSKLRKKLENVAGKQATIVYAGAGDMGGILYKITDISKEGIVIENTVHKIFLPIAQVLRLPIILPVDDYKTMREKYEKESIEKMSGALFEPILNKLEESLEQNITQPDSDISASIEHKVISVLEVKGLLRNSPQKQEQ